MFPNLALSGLLAFALSLSVGRASPIESSQGLVKRENAPSGLKCGNAPQITSGDMVRPEDYNLQTTLPPSGSDEKWFKYQYCTVGTKTYTFFGIGEINSANANISRLPFHNVYSSFYQSAITVNDNMARRGGDGGIGDGWKFIQPNTKITLDVNAVKGQTLTYGILSSALTGMANAALNFNPTNAPMVFTIGDSQWGTIATGYAGIIDNDGHCVIEVTADRTVMCSEISSG